VSSYVLICFVLLMDGFLSLIFIYKVFLLFFLVSKAWSGWSFTFILSLGCVFLCSHLPCTFDRWFPSLIFMYKDFLLFFLVCKAWSMHIWVAVSRFSKCHNFMSHVWLTSCSIMWIQRVLTGNERCYWNPLLKTPRFFPLYLKAPPHTKDAVVDWRTFHHSPANLWPVK
jgi:hypothetical protein